MINVGDLGRLSSSRELAWRHSLFRHVTAKLCYHLLFWHCWNLNTLLLSHYINVQNSHSSLLFFSRPLSRYLCLPSLYSILRLFTAEQLTIVSVRDPAACQTMPLHTFLMASRVCSGVEHSANMSTWGEARQHKHRESADFHLCKSVWVPLWLESHCGAQNLLRSNSTSRNLQALYGTCHWLPGSDVT